MPSFKFVAVLAQHSLPRGVRTRRPHSIVLQRKEQCLFAYAPRHRLFSYHNSFATMAQMERLADHLDAPEIDDRSYRIIRLPNKLEALLVHDIDTDKASASVNVQVGSFSDPEDMPGMAHAVEHLLFMGTEKVLIGAQRRLSCALKSFSILEKTRTVSTSQPIRDIRMHTLDLQKRITSSRLPHPPR